jgi:hypothetical protein
MNKQKLTIEYTGMYFTVNNNKIQVIYELNNRIVHEHSWEISVNLTTSQLKAIVHMIDNPQVAVELVNKLESCVKEEQ